MYCTIVEPIPPPERDLPPVWCIRFRDSYFGLHVPAAEEKEEDMTRSLIFAFSNETDAMRFRTMLCDHFAAVGEWPSRIVHKEFSFPLHCSQSSYNCAMAIDTYPLLHLLKAASLEGILLAVVRIRQGDPDKFVMTPYAMLPSSEELREHLDHLFKV